MRHEMAQHDAPERFTSVRQQISAACIYVSVRAEAARFRDESVTEYSGAANERLGGTPRTKPEYQSKELRQSHAVRILVDLRGHHRTIDPLGFCSSPAENSARRLLGPRQGLAVDPGVVVNPNRDVGTCRLFSRWCICH